MSFSLVGVNAEGSTIVVNTDDLPQPPPTPTFPQADTSSSITPFSNFLNLSSFANNFSTISTITTVPGFSTFSTNPSWNPYAPAQDPQLDDINPYGSSLNSLNNGLLNKNKRMWETPGAAQAAAIRKKRKQNFFEEDEATCAKCHYRRKCMKCTNCFARFCEQRCLPRYLEDQTAQEEVRQTNSWLCPCCKGIEPPGKYKGSDILRKDVEDSKDKDDEDDDPKPSSTTPQPITPQQSPIQAQPQNFYPDQHQHNQSFNPYAQNPNFQLQQQMRLQQQQQEQQLKMQQIHLQQQQQLQQQQIQQMQQQQIQQQMFQQQMHQQLQMQQQFQLNPNPQFPPHLQQHMLQSPIPPQLRQNPQQSPVASPAKQGYADGTPTRSSTKAKANGGGAGGDEKETNGNGTTGGNGGAVVGVGEETDPSEYPKETEDYCSVCGDIFSYDDNNEIIYCDGCNVAVHQACYGVSKVPAGEWLCDRCKSKVLPTCYLCSQKGGAMKEIIDRPNHWVHVTCVAALYELRPLDYSKKLGPAGLLDKIDTRRYKLKCETCRELNVKNVTGPLIQCKRKRCAKAFHPICCKRKLSYCKDLGIFVTYCKQHATDATQETPQ